MEPDENTQAAVDEQQPIAETEVPAPEVQEDPEAQPSENLPVEEEIDLEDFSNSRYPTVQGNPSDLVNEVSQELAQLPTDESGTVEAKAAAEWFASKLSQVESRAEQRARQAAQEVFTADAAEKAQQTQLLKKYPEITKDKDRLEAVFDFRDAAALRGETLTLAQAAAKLDKFRQQDKTEGVQSAQRQTTIQAAAHLETASNKGSTQQVQVDLSDKNQRQALLRQFVQNELKEGRIQTPG